jgi:DNA-binding NarL/FixJ family response regulator
MPMLTGQASGATWTATRIVVIHQPRLVARPRHDSPLQTLTERELAVLAQMAEGRSNHAIAGQLHMSPKTVETHIGSLLAKLSLPPAPEDHRRVLAVLTYLRR